MTATASTKELGKALATYLASPTLPLPADVNQVIQAYLEKHARHDEAAGDRLQEELRQIHQKLVQGQPSRIAPFLAILRTIRPGIWSALRVMQWYDLLSDDILDHIWEEKDLAAETLANVEDTVTTRTDDIEGLEAMLGRAQERWMRFSEMAEQTQDPSIPFKEKILRETLVKWGKKQPKLLMTTLSSRLVKKEYRARSIMMLCEFVRNQPPHLHLVAQTPLFDNILTCLQRDTSTTVIRLALTALTMLLPHLPSSLVPHLPTLFSIYARLLFWDRERSSEAQGHSGLESEDGDQWEIVKFAPETEDVEIPQLMNYFTILYGLYPINFMDYIRKPQRYLRHANAPNPDDIEVQPSEIRHRSEKFRQMHLLHPNFYSLTIDSEKTDFGRWIKSEPAVVVAECMALCTAAGAGEFGAESNGTGPLGGTSSLFPSDEADRSSSGGALLSSSVVFSPPQGPLASNWRYTQSAAVDSPAGSRAHSMVMRQNSQSSHPSTRDSLEARGREMGVDSPTLPPLMVSSPSQTQLQEMIYSNKVMKSSVGQSVANDSVPSLVLSHQDSFSERPAASTLPSQTVIRSPIAVTESGGEVSRLRRQIMVLNNDLNFERYMKQQHMAHIGELRRRHMKEAATEAETQNLIINNRNLKNRLEDAKRAELQVKNESEKSRAVARKYQATLSDRLKTLKEEHRARSTELEALKRELNSAREECEKLRVLVCEAEVKELNSKQTMQSIDIDMSEMSRLRGVVERLSASERDYQAKQMEMEVKLEEAAAAVQRAEVLGMKVVSLEGELQATKDHYQSQIVVLNTKLAEALKGSRGRSEGDVVAMFESALAASRAKQAELQKQYNELLRKNSILQSSLLDQAQSSRARGDGAGSAEADAEVSAIVGPSLSFSARARMHRGLSDTDSFELSQQGSFGSSAASSAGTTIHRPSTPSSQGHSEISGMTTSPQSERYYGRGGVQNTNRKDRKERRRDEDKRERKSSGIRGIRGFV